MRSAFILIAILLAFTPILPGVVASDNPTAWGALYEVGFSGKTILASPSTMDVSSGQLYVGLKAEISPSSSWDLLIINPESNSSVLYYLDAGDNSITPLALSYAGGEFKVAASLEADHIYYAVMVDTKGIHEYTVAGQQLGYRVIKLDSAYIGKSLVVYGGSDTGEPFLLVINTSSWDTWGYTIRSPTSPEHEEIIDVKEDKGIIYALGKIVWSIDEWVGTSLLALKPRGDIVSYATLSTGKNTRLEPAALAVLSDGRIVVGGSTTASTTVSYDYSDAWIAVLKITPEGFQLEKSFFFGGDSEDSITSIIPTSDGGFVVIGNTWVNGEKIFVVKFDSNSNPAGVELITDPGTEGVITASADHGIVYIGSAYIGYGFMDGSYKPIASPIILSLPYNQTVNITWNQCPQWGCPHKVSALYYHSLTDAGIPVKIAEIGVETYNPNTELVKITNSSLPVEDKSHKISLKPYIARVLQQYTTTTGTSEKPFRTTTLTEQTTASTRTSMESTSSLSKPKSVTASRSTQIQTTQKVTEASTDVSNQRGKGSGFSVLAVIVVALMIAGIIILMKR